jgi:hypothetical protein
MDNEGEPGLLPPGVSLIDVVLDDLAGRTIVEIEEDTSVRVLGPTTGGMYLFPSRQGIADFLASGEAHSLTGRLDDFDAANTAPEYGADFVYMRDESDDPEEIAAMRWMECLLVVDACGVIDPPTVEDAMTQVAAVTTLRVDFEQPGYLDRDYWMEMEAQPVQLTLPSGTGVTIVAVHEFGEGAPAFLGDRGEVLLFRDPADLLAYLHAEGTDEMRKEPYWPANPPDCEPRMVVDVRQADPRDLRSDAYVFLRALATVLTKRESELSVHKMSNLTNERRVRKAVDRVADVLREVNGKITWR